MSLFLITESRNKAEALEKTWFRLFGQSVTKQIHNNLYIVITDAFRKTRSCATSSDANSMHCFGTYFSESGFGISALNAEPSDEIETIQDSLFGHYVFVLQKREKTIVFTDPLGLINVYWSARPGELLISNCLAAIVPLSEDRSFNPQGIYEFVLREGTVGEDTVFSSVKRLKLNNALSIEGTVLQEVPLKQRIPEKMTFAQYVERIDRYFNAVSSYGGRIAAELSAGYDTRLVAACAASAIPKLRSVTNENLEYDADAKIARQLAAVLGLKHQCIKRPPNRSVDSNAEMLLHASSVGRDVVRSRSSLDIARAKFVEADLILGGYGGEVMRAKYCKFSNVVDFAHGYYGQYRHMTNLGLESIALPALSDKLGQEYMRDWIASSYQLCNWLYAADRMRIWGGARVTMMSLFGDNLHPFMDWYLLAPLITWNQLDLEHARMQKEIITHYAPSALTLPINPKIIQPSRLSNVGRAILTAVTQAFREAPVSGIKSVYRQYSRDRFSAEFDGASLLNLQTIELRGTKNHLSRFATLQIASDLLCV